MNDLYCICSYHPTSLLETASLVSPDLLKRIKLGLESEPFSERSFSTDLVEQLTKKVNPIEILYGLHGNPDDLAFMFSFIPISNCCPFSKERVLSIKHQLEDYISFINSDQSQPIVKIKTSSNIFLYWTLIYSQIIKSELNLKFPATPILIGGCSFKVITPSQSEGLYSQSSSLNSALPVNI